MIFTLREFPVAWQIGCLAFSMLLSLSGCVMPSYSGWTRISDVSYVDHPISQVLSEEQVKQAILKGIQGTVGWKGEPGSKGKVFATYQVRNHTVDLMIEYTSVQYRYLYLNSKNMKVYCTDRDFDKQREPEVTGQSDGSRGPTCSGSPAWIHANYKRWIAALDESIQNSLAAI